jgi:hypothetical protein
MRAFLLFALDSAATALVLQRRMRAVFYGVLVYWLLRPAINTPIY